MQFNMGDVLVDGKSTGTAMFLSLLFYYNLMLMRNITKCDIYRYQGFVLAVVPQSQILELPCLLAPQ